MPSLEKLTTLLEQTLARSKRTLTLLTTRGKKVKDRKSLLALKLVKKVKLLFEVVLSFSLNDNSKNSYSSSKKENSNYNLIEKDEEKNRK